MSLGNSMTVYDLYISSHWSLEGRSLGLEWDRGHFFLHVSSSCSAATVILFTLWFKKKIIKENKTSLTHSKKHGLGPQLRGLLALWPWQTPSFPGLQFPIFKMRRWDWGCPESPWPFRLWNFVRRSAGEAPGPLEPRVLRTEGHSPCGIFS